MPNERLACDECKGNAHPRTKLRNEQIARAVSSIEYYFFTAQARKTYVSTLKGARKYVFLAFVVKSIVRN